MTLSFTQTPADLQDFITYGLKRSPVIRGIGIISGIMVAIYGYNFFSREGFSGENVLSILLPLALVAVIWTVVFKTLLKKRVRNPGTQSSAARQLKVELSDKEIGVYSPSTETRYQWAGIVKFGQSNKSYFLYLDRVKAIIIPKRAFDSKAEALKFEELVDSKLQKS